MDFYAETLSKSPGKTLVASPTYYKLRPSNILPFATMNYSAILRK